MANYNIPQEELLTFKQTSNILKVHPNTLRLWDKNGILKAIRFGKRGDRRYKRDDVLQLMGTDTSQPSLSQGTSIDFFKHDFERAIERLARFQFLINELSGAHTSLDIADILIKQGMETMQAQSGLIYLLDDSGQMLKILHAIGFKKRELNHWNNMPITAPIHLADAVRTGNVIFIESIEEGKIRYPLTIKIAQASENTSFAAAPLVIDKKIIGVLCLSFSSSKKFSEEDRLFIQALGRQCAQALERVQAESIVQRSEEKYRTLFNSLEDGACLIEALFNKEGFSYDYRFLAVNDAWEKQVGITNLVGKTAGEVYPDRDDRQWWCDLHAKVAQTGKRKRFEHFDDESQKWYRVVMNRVYDNEKHLVFVVFKDITDIKEQQKQKDEFLSMAAHEIKTPVTSIKAYAQILQKHLANNVDEKSTYFLQNINTQVEKLVTLVGDFLDISKIEVGKLALRESKFDLQGLVTQTVKDFQYITDTHTIKYTPHEKCIITGDQERLSQVILNLLTNAVKYSPKNDEIIITMHKEKNRIGVCIQDFGEGIPSGKQKEIFEKYFRMNERDKKSKKNLGLGLYISAEIIKRHRGEIWVESKKGKGSTFCFSLPLKK